MNSRKDKGKSVLNEHRNDIIDDNMLVVEDVNQNSTDIRYQSKSLMGATAGTLIHKGQPIQILEHNGQIFVPLQEDYLLQSKSSKQIDKDGPNVNKMNHIKDNKRYDIHDFQETPNSYYHLQETAASTPKRTRDQLNKSQEQRKKSKKDEAQCMNTRSSTPNYQDYPSPTTNPPVEKNYSLPMDQLRRAVGNNLPCFIIEFEKTIAPRDLPSAVITCDLIREHFINNNIFINDFSVAVFLGHRLKLGVNNMEDYFKLALSETWPTSINKKKITIIKPKYVPECFTLVIRYVSKLISLQTVTDEIKRSIGSANNFKQIMYSFNRPQWRTQDFDKGGAQCT